MSGFGDENPLKLEKIKAKKAKRKEKLEARRLLREAKRQKIIKDHFERELALCQVNFEKCEEKWNEVFDKYAVSDLKWDLSAFRDSFHKWVSLKSSELQLILESFEELSEQNRLLATACLGGVDELLGLYFSRMADCQRGFSEKASQEKTTFELERKMLCIKEEEACENLSTTISYQQEKEELTRNKLQNNLDENALDLESKHFTDMEKLENNFNETVEWLLMNLQVKIKTHFYFNDETYKKYEELRAKDQNGLDTTFECRFKIKKLEQTINAMKKTSRAFILECNIPKLLTEKRTLLVEFSTLDKKSSKVAKEDREKLKLLSNAAKQSITNLETIWERRKKIIDLSELCRKYETGQEAFGLSNGMFEDFCTQAEIICLKTQIAKLTEENRKLKSLLRNVLQQFNPGIFS